MNGSLRFRRCPPVFRSGIFLLLAACLLVAGCSLPNRLVFATDNRLDFPPLPADFPFEEILFPAGDNLHLYGWHVQGEEGRPLVLVFHGTATNLSRRLDNLFLLHRLGVSIFIFDYRGFGQSDGSPSIRGTYEDARAALAYLQGRGWTPRQMIYFGHSLGAALALQLALEAPPAGLILESPFTSLEDLISHHAPPFRLFSWAFADDYDNLGKIDRLSSPLLILQGVDDTIVPAEMALALYRTASAPKHLVIVTGADHANLPQVGGDVYWTAWKRFLEMACGPRTAQAGSRQGALPGHQAAAK